MTATPPVPAQFADRAEAFQAGHFDAHDGEGYEGDGPYVDAPHNEAYVAGWRSALAEMIGAES